MSKPYYRFDCQPVEPDQSFSLKSFRFCACCQQVVDQSGGGRGFICHGCKEILDRGLLATVFAEINDLLRQGKDWPKPSNRL